MGKQARRPSPQHDTAYIALRKRLQAIRQEAGVTQEALGEAFGRPHTFVHKVEFGDRRIDPVEFCRWCQACGVDPADEIARLAKTVKRTRPL